MFARIKSQFLLKVMYLFNILSACCVLQELERRAVMFLEGCSFRYKIIFLAFANRFLTANIVTTSKHLFKFKLFNIKYTMLPDCHYRLRRRESAKYVGWFSLLVLVEWGIDMVAHPLCCEVEIPQNSVKLVRSSHQQLWSFIVNIEYVLCSID